MSTVAALRPEQSAAMNVEAEQVVIGSALIDPAIVGQLISAGGDALFAEPVHVEILAALREKVRLGHRADAVTVGGVMRGSQGLAELGGNRYLVRLAGVSNQVAVREYIRLLADLANKRALISAMADANAAIAKGQDKASDIAARLEAQLISASDTDPDRGPMSMKAAVRATMLEIAAACRGDETNTVSTGIGALDRLVGGFAPGELIILGGRPSMGKTAVALSIALNVARTGKGVAIASLEMSPQAMALRALSEATAQAGHAASYKQMRRGELAQSQIDTLRSVAAHVENLPIQFLERKFADLDALIAGCRQIKRSMGDDLKLLVVDYLQLIEAKGENRTQEISRISRALKALAGTLNVPIIALSQLSRGVESREDKRPMLSDLRESGQIEQDADAVMFCYRDEYYIERMRPTDDADPEKLDKWGRVMEAARNRLEIIVGKHRQGEIGTAHVRCNVALNLIWEDR